MFSPQPFQLSIDLLPTIVRLYDNISDFSAFEYLISLQRFNIIRQLLENLATHSLLQLLHLFVQRINRRLQGY